MAYTTYDFYTKEYFGDSITESLFPKWESRAEVKLNFLTNGNIADEKLKEYGVEIQKATCALADVLYNIEQAIIKASSTDKDNVKSMSSGGESITYNVQESLYQKAIGSVEMQNQLCYDAIREYLSNTGLLYWGC